MKSRGVRMLLVILAIASLGVAGFAAWRFEQRTAAERSAADTFERDARQIVISLGELRAAQQGYVAAGQAPDSWLARAAALSDAIGSKLAALRVAAGTVEAQGALESSIEAFATFGQHDGRAREYLKSGQQLSASDVIFADGASTLEKVVHGIDSARGQESIAHAVAVDGARKRELIACAAGLVVPLLVLILLVPIPRTGEAGAPEMADSMKATGGGLGLSREMDGVVRRAEPLAPPARAAGASAAAGAATAAFPPPKPGALPKPAALPVTAPAASDDVLGPIGFDDEFGLAPSLDLAAIADVCSALARVQYTSELQGLLERVSKALDATGVIIWIPDVTYGTLRPALTHGYTPLALMRMGGIQPTADNATATAFRTKTVVAVPSEVLARGAIVAPLITADGCSGALAVELREGVDPTSRMRAAAAIVAAQLAMLLTPAAAGTQEAPATGTPATAAPAGDAANRKG